MIFLSLILATFAHAKTPESEIIQVFKKTQTVQEKFLKDTMNNRQETESFEANDFVPSVNKMIGLLEKKQCKTCLTNYLQALAFLDGSADETLTDQLKQIISKDPKSLSSACSKSSKATKERLKVRFRDAVHFLAEEKKGDQAKIEKSISVCL